MVVRKHMQGVETQSRQELTSFCNPDWVHKGIEESSQPSKCLENRDTLCTNVEWEEFNEESCYRQSD